MQHLALGGELVFCPDVFQFDERELPRAKQVMLQAGEVDGFLGLHGCR